MHYSCSECHRRKHKVRLLLTQCDRKIPCQPCIDRGTAELCHPYGEGDQFGNLHERVRRLEVLLQGLASDHKNVERHLASLDHETPQRPGPAVQDASNTSSGAASESEDTAGPSALYGMEREELKRLESSREAVDRKPGGEMLSDHGSSWYGELALPSMSQRAVYAEVDGEQLEVKSSIPRSPASVCIDRLIAEGGANPNCVRSLMEMLPPKEECDMLMQTYFCELNYIILPIHERTFRLLYEELIDFWFGAPARREQGEGARLLPFLTIVYFFFAHAALSLPEEDFSDEETVRKAMHFFHAGRRTLEVSSYIRGDHIDLVLANVLASKFCIMLRRTTQVWMYIGAAVRGAHSIGLHRDGSKLGLDQVTTERRRRVWATVYHWEKVISILVARPSAVRDAHCDTLPPSDVQLHEMNAAAPALPSTGYVAATRPSPLLFLPMRYALGRLMGQIGDLYQNLQSPVKHEDVMRLDRDLEAFRESLPSFYRMPDQPGVELDLDAESPWLPFHRFLIQVELNFTRITLHRPYVLRSDPKYRRSREIAFEVAYTDRLARQAFDRAVPKRSRARTCKLGGLYRLFNTVLIFGIMLLLERDPGRAAEQRAFLEEFVEQNSGRTDLCSRREVKIVQMFLARADERRATHGVPRRASHPGARGAPGPAPAPRMATAPAQPQAPRWEDNEFAQSFLTNLGGFNKALSLFPPSIANETPLQHNNLYTAPPLSLDVNGLDLFRPSGDVSQPVDPASFDQRLAAYDDTLDPYSLSFSGVLPPGDSSHTPGIFPGFQPFAPLDPYATTPKPAEGYVGGEPAPPMDAGIMPWGGLINAIVPPSP